MPNEESKRTSLDLPLSLWKRVKVRAVEENRDFRSLVIRALEDYLGVKPPRGGRR
jgi:hypothetical protein